MLAQGPLLKLIFKPFYVFIQLLLYLTAASGMVLGWFLGSQTGSSVPIAYKSAFAGGNAAYQIPLTSVSSGFLGSAPPSSAFDRIPPDQLFSTSKFAQSPIGKAALHPKSLHDAGPGSTGL